MPSSAVTRLNKITYAGTEVGVGTNYHLHGAIQLSQDYTTLTLRFLVICHDTTEATFVSQCSALETALRTPNGNLKLEIGGSTAFDLSHASNTGMLAAGFIRKVGSSLDSNNTRLYSCSVSVQLPADEAGKSGRQSSKVSYVSSGSEVVTLSVSAVYTGLAGNAALAHATAAFPAYATALHGVAGRPWVELSRALPQEVCSTSSTRRSSGSALHNSRPCMTMTFRMSYTLRKEHLRIQQKNKFFLLYSGGVYYSVVNGSTVAVLPE